MEVRAGSLAAQGQILSVLVIYLNAFCGIFDMVLLMIEAVDKSQLEPGLTAVQINPVIAAAQIKPDLPGYRRIKSALVQNVFYLAILTNLADHHLYAATRSIGNASNSFL